jgi:hypothetical protein
LSSLAYQPDLVITLNSFNALPDQSDVIGRAARIAVGVVHVPHWRPYIARNQLCFDTALHGIQCFCWKTLESMNSTQCINVDECCKNNGGCSHACTDTEGSYHCGCPEGLQLGDDRSTCEDINECQNDPCNGNGECLNTYGGYECLYNSQFSPLVGGETVLASVNSAGVGTVVGATVATAVGTVILMLVIAVVVSTLRRKQASSNAGTEDSSSDEPKGAGHDNLGFRGGRSNATMKASSRAFDNVSASGSSVQDVDSLSNFSVSNVM